jgi:hypothetical protein
MIQRHYVDRIVLTAMLAVSLVACASSNSDAARSAANSCGGDPFLPISATNQFVPGPSEVFFPSPSTPTDWLRRARQRAQLAAVAAADDPYWQPLADAWGISEAAARAVEQPDLSASAGDLKLAYAMVTKDAYCRIALTQIGTKLSPGQ